MVFFVDGDFRVYCGQVRSHSDYASVVVRGNQVWDLDDSALYNDDNGAAYILVCPD